jgi:hypothetical protein
MGQAAVVMGADIHPQVGLDQAAGPVGIEVNGNVGGEIVEGAARDLTVVADGRQDVVGEIDLGRVR